LLSLLQLLQDEDARPFPQDEAIACFIKGTTRVLGRIVAGRERAHGTEATQRQRRDGRFTAATQHNISIPALDDFIGFPNGVRASGAGCHNAGIGAAQTKTHADMTRGYIGD
jgi:hypothetical protein